MNAIVGEKMNIDCPTTNWTGDIILTGNVEISGTSTAKGDHVSANISGKGHVHTEQGDGADTSGPK
jgi:phage baseplate assembly protein gpV